MKHSVEEIKLKNGAMGLLIDVPGASVMATRVQFRAGMQYVKNHDIYELPHLVEHLAFGSNAKYKDEQAFEAEFTKNGAYHNAWTSDVSVCYETECADFGAGGYDDEAVAGGAVAGGEGGAPGDWGIEVES